MADNEKFGLLDRMSGLAFRMFGKQARSIAKRMPELTSQILKSNMRITPEALVALAIFATVISIVIVMVSIAVVLTMFPHYAFFSIAIAAVPPLVFLLVIKSPGTSASGRAASLDNELPFVIGFITVLGSGGVSPVAALRRLSTMSGLFPAASKEANRILVDIDVFGMDPLTALEKAAANSPNKAFSKFLYGYTTVIKTGGNVSSFLDNAMKEIYDDRVKKTKKSTNIIAVLAESYVTLTAVLGISLFVIFQAQALISHNSSGLLGVEVFGLLGVPLVSAVFIFLLDSIQVRYPYVEYWPYKVFLFSVPAGVVIALLPIPLPLFFKTGLAMAAITAAPMYVSIKMMRERSALERVLPEFIRDISEGRKLGLSPEATLQGLMEKNYGLLSKHVKKMGAQLSWGVSLANVISTFMTEAKSWLARVTARLLIEVIDVGGGTVKSFSDMSDFLTKMNDMESEKRSEQRPYMFILYFSAIMVLVATLIMVYYISMPITLGGTSNVGTRVGQNIQLFSIDKGTVDVMLTVALFEGWVIGFVAGKMGNGSVLEGFKHSFTLVLIGMITVLIIQSVLGLNIF